MLGLQPRLPGSSMSRNTPAAHAGPPLFLCSPPPLCCLVPSHLLSCPSLPGPTLHRTSSSPMPCPGDTRACARKSMFHLAAETELLGVLQPGQVPSELGTSHAGWLSPLWCLPLSRCGSQDRPRCSLLLSHPVAMPGRTKLSSPGCGGTLGVGWVFNRPPRSCLSGSWTPPAPHAPKVARHDPVLRPQHSPVSPFPSWDSH